MAESEPERIAALEAEVDQLKRAVTSHAVVDQAIGMMVAFGRVTPRQGWEVLRDVSQHTNIKLRNVAELVLIWGRRGEFPYEIGAALEDALDRYGRARTPGGDPEPVPAPEEPVPAPEQPAAPAPGRTGSP
ncbi:ANTAR domain-containing protein [Streptomyces hygroscopicus subsp. hygroscopicus]|nr:ANTAR domain-containing protein [Streptomyces hygroscopicus subsp. hygroscopicus]